MPKFLTGPFATAFVFTGLLDSKFFTGRLNKFPQFFTNRKFIRKLEILMINPALHRFFCPMRMVRSLFAWECFAEKDSDLVVM
jgi:hypothetical protein